MDNITPRGRHFNPDRICEAISKIGYSVHSAIMDIVDNSVAAKATIVTLAFSLREAATKGSKNGLSSIAIIDDGLGMTDEDIDKALDFGSEVEYAPNSLSKYGLGLKSAGFSLGRKIEVLSKRNGKYSSLHCLDRDFIRDEGILASYCLEPSEEDKKVLDTFESGTVIRITQLNSPFPSYNKVRSDLMDKIGSVYHGYMTDNSCSVTISMSVNGDLEAVPPKDILFWDIAEEELDEDEYSGKLPVRVIDQLIEHPGNPDATPMRLQGTIFPMANMASYPGFSKEEQDQIKSYKVGRANAGFFIFRNERLIRWGDKFSGLHEKSCFGLRLRLNVSTDHDDLLHVDVSKQRIEVPEDIEETLETLIRIPIAKALTAFDLCRRMKREAKGEEGETFEANNETLEEEDALESPDDSHEETIKRTKKLGEKSSAAEKKEEDSADKEQGQQDAPGSEKDSEEEVPEKPAIFRKIRYSDKVHGLDAWKNHFDDKNGTYVRINKNHMYYLNVLSRMAPGAPERQAIEGLIWSQAVAYNNTFKGLTSVEDEIIEKVFATFFQQLTVQLNSWAMHNQGIFDE
ncbi:MULTISPECIES: ATP-binding protein [Kordiimonas]|uniref:ATP-binding protein n=1 Tax=Kordiimonas TaxID=288021 RepID=UPI00257F9F19|nr:ATP-binding protein [Kordiimonas sp. UBA4487]